VPELGIDVISDRIIEFVSTFPAIVPSIGATSPFVDSESEEDVSSCRKVTGSA